MKLLWLSAGTLLGVALTFAALALPPVQGWLVRYAVRSQMGGDVEFGTVRVGPTGATAQELRLHLPNFAVEARALRLAVSPWQLLTRRRLAIDAVEARDLQFTAKSTNAPSAPFIGLLADLQAPIDWAVAQAEAEGRFILEQPGADPLIATFTVRGREFSADRSAPIDVEFSVSGDFVPGWNGRWKFIGQLAYRPGANGTLEGVTLAGTLQPARHPAFAALPLKLTASINATADGEAYTVTLANADAAHPALTGAVQANFERTSGVIRGDWSFDTAATLAAHFLRRADTPDLALSGRGSFIEQTRNAELTLDGEVTLLGENWAKFAPAFAHLGAANGQNAFQITRRGDRWELNSFDATLTVAGSDARLRFRSLVPQPVSPFRAGDIAWAELEISDIPLAWAKPFLPDVQLEGGILGGAWHASTPTAAELKLTPTRPIATGRFVAGHPALPAAQPLELTLSPVVRLTPDTVQIELRPLRFIFERGDLIDVNLASIVDFAQLTATAELDWTAQLPSFLAGPDFPLPFTLSGKINALASEHHVVVKTARLDACIAERAPPVFAAELLAEATYHFADERLDVPLEFARIAANGLPLEWLSRFVDGYTLTGVVGKGEAVLGWEDDRIVTRTKLPWTLTQLGIAQGDETLVRDATIEVAPDVRVNWPPTDTPVFTADLTLRATLPEAALIVDPTGPLSAGLTLSGGRDGKFLHLTSAQLDVRRGNGDPLFALQTESPMTFRPETPTETEQPLWFKAQLGRVPLELFQAYLGEGQELVGEIEPAEFIAHAAWPNASVKSVAPVAVQLIRFADKGVTLLEDVRFTAEPGAQNAAIVHAAYVENVRGLPAGATELGSLGSGFILFFGDNYTVPVALEYQTQIDLRQWQNQPVADAFSLPATGLVTVGYEHDLFNDKRPAFHFSLEHVVGKDDKPIAPLRAKALLESDAVLAKNEIGMHFEIELATEPRVSKVEFDATLSNDDKRVNVNSVLKGAFVDIAEIERLIATTERARPTTGQVAAEAPTIAAESARPTSALTPPATDNPVLEYPFWLVLRGRFDLELGEVARDHYVIQDVRGALTLADDALAVTDLSGRTFDGAWGGDLHIDFDPSDTAAPYRARGGFHVKELDAGKIVAAVYPEDTALFTGRLSFDSEVKSQGAHLFGLMNNTAARFDFRADGGRLRVNVPHAQLASAALVFGGVVTFSPEIRALGRLIRTFADMPVETLHARGHRDPDGLVSLDEFRVHTPQLRLSATGTWPLKNNADWLTTPFELPVQMEARDEIGVILKGMRLLEKQPGADGFFRMTRTPKLKGTPGNPDTSELFDLLAHAADKSSGTFGFLMRKLQKEVEKAQAKTK